MLSKYPIGLKTYRDIHIFKYLASALPRLSIIESGIWPFLCLYRLQNLIKISHIWLKIYGDFHVLHFCASALPRSMKSSNFMPVG